MEIPLSEYARLPRPQSRSDNTRSGASFLTDQTLNHGDGLPFTHKAEESSDHDTAAGEQTGHERQKTSDPMKDLAKEQTDLLLDLAMTTAFNSLLDGVPITDWTSLASFAGLFVLIWWVWASQVLYHARFREKDWLHVIMYFVCQLAIFMCFPVFTSNFDVTDGIVEQSTTSQLDTYLHAQGWSQLAIDAQNSRTSRISVRELRGISMIMALSRVMILVEYLCTIRRHLYPTESPEKERMDNAKSLRQRHQLMKQKELWVHCGTLFVSLGCYVITFLIIGLAPTRGDQVTKICLWYIALVVEIGAHFIVAHYARLQQWEFDAAAVYRRRSAIFTIILGSGLDRITSNFQFMIGNISFGPHRIFIMFCAGLTIIFLFTLHYTNIRPPEEVENELGRRRRILASFFFNFFYLCALIVTLQGMNSLLQIGNIGDTLQTAFEFLRQTEAQLNSSDFTSPVLPQFYMTETVEKLETAGYNISQLLAQINVDIPSLFPNDVTYPFKKALLVDMDIIASGLRGINVIKEDDSLFSNEIYAFIDSGRIEDFSNASSSAVANLTKDCFIEVTTSTLEAATATPALWFAAAGGLVLMLLACMEILDHWRVVQHLLLAGVRRKRESVTNPSAVAPKPSSDESGGVEELRRGQARALQISGKLICGCLLLALTALANRRGGVQLDDQYNFHGSRIWSLAIQNWLLPLYVLVLFLLQAYEYLVVLWLDGNLNIDTDMIRTKLRAMKSKKDDDTNNRHGMREPRFAPEVAPV